MREERSHGVGVARVTGGRYGEMVPATIRPHPTVTYEVRCEQEDGEQKGGRNVSDSPPQPAWTLRQRGTVYATVGHCKRPAAVNQHEVLAASEDSREADSGIS